VLYGFGSLVALFLEVQVQECEAAVHLDGEVTKGFL